MTSGNHSAPSSPLAPPKALMVLDPEWVKRLALNECRLPPTYVGVRRVRPSNDDVRSAFRGLRPGEKDRPVEKFDPSAFMIVDPITGEERRMTKKEKRAKRRKLKKEANEQLKKLSEIEESTQSFVQQENEDVSKKPDQPSGDDGSKYHQLSVDSKVVEEELADLRGERNGVPPVLLNPEMWSETSDLQRQPLLDNDMSKEWAKALKANMKEAETVRSKEDMRPMAYRLVPEVWSRLRPACLSNTMASKLNGSDEKGQIAVFTPALLSPLSTLSMAIRPTGHELDRSKQVVFDVLFRNTKIHVSCDGVKFGCDFLLYDGPRQERHSFAGLRVLHPEVMPTPYDLAGYVRGLNTAGKLALLAKVEWSRVDDETACRVAIVDIALEKILTAPTHIKHNRTQKRKKMGIHLSKVTTTTIESEEQGIREDSNASKKSKLNEGNKD